MFIKFKTLVLNFTELEKIYFKFSRSFENFIIPLTFGFINLANLDFKQEIIKSLQKITNEKEINLEVPPDISFGDYAFPCFGLAKVFKKNPNQVAIELAEKIQLDKNLDKIISKVEVKTHYLNFFVNKEQLSKNVLKDIISNKKYGSLNLGNNQKILVEHTSINPNASPHVGRARNAFIGDSIVRLLRFQSYNVETHYFVNDVGKQIAMLVLGAENKPHIKFDELLNLYIKINDEIEKNPELEKKVFELLYQLERNKKISNFFISFLFKLKFFRNLSSRTIKRFKEIVDVCVKGQVEILSELGIKYDKFDYESDYLWNKKTDEILKKLGDKLFTDEQGRKVLNQEEFKLAMKAPYLVLTRSDGTSLYPLRDLAYHYAVKKEKSILILGEDQKLYFQQIKAALQVMKHAVPDAVFYSFVLLPEGKMSTRKGNLVLLEDFMKQALEKAKKEMLNRYNKIDEKNAKKIAYGAIKYAILKVSPEKNVIFDWEQALNFEGDSGPYLQYAYVRIHSIIKNYNKSDKSVDKLIKQNIDSTDFSLFREKEELELIKLLAEFPDIVKSATDNLKPHLIANYLYNLSSKFALFYSICPVLKAKEEIKQARLLLILCIKRVLENGLSLLGIEILEKM